MRRPTYQVGVQGNPSYNNTTLWCDSITPLPAQPTCSPKYNLSYDPFISWKKSAYFTRLCTETNIIVDYISFITFSFVTWLLCPNV